MKKQDKYLMTSFALVKLSSNFTCNKPSAHKKAKSIVLVLLALGVTHVKPGLGMTLPDQT